MNNNTYQIAQDIEKCISEVHDSHKEWLVNTPKFQAISYSLSKLINRSREYINPSFVVLVVGPVKAGKSTFVNLVANNYVSPTHFLECTVRPSIIHTGEKGQITIYRSKDIANDAKQMDDILDCINGLIEKESVTDIDTTEVDLTESNINEYVKGGVRNEDNIILTAITTKGGPLIQENVFLVDMPGFDGSKANFDDLYATIVKRADLIIFVQSSNSAISKISSNFFDFIRTHNTSAPISLIHNVFEAAYWRADSSKTEDIEYQRQYAIHAIQQKGLSISEENAFNVNLGMVSDKRNNRYETNEERLILEDAHFTKTEGKLHDLFKKRESIRISNCISRCAIQKSDLLDKIESTIAELNKLYAKYKETESAFDELKLSHWPVTEENESEDSITIDPSYLRSDIAEVEYNSIKNEVTRDKYTTDVARAIAQKFLDSVEAKLNKYLNFKITELNYLKTCKSINAHIAKIIKTASDCNIHPDIELNVDFPHRTVEFKPYNNFDTLIPYLSFAFKHTDKEVKKYLEAILQKLLGEKLKITNTYTKGYLNEEIVTQMYDIISKAKSKYKSDICTALNIQIEKLKCKALKEILPDIELYNDEITRLESLRNDLNKIIIPSF